MKILTDLVHAWHRGCLNVDRASVHTDGAINKT